MRKLTRRRFLSQSLGATGAFGALGALGCAPAAHTQRPRQIVARFSGVPTQDGAGVSLLRIIGQPRLQNLDPFVLLDRLHSDNPAAYIKGFPDHPHRGFETITVMLDGFMRHKDSRGNHGLIRGGGLQWMTAGRGVVHSEMPEQDAGLLSGFQLWLNLPAQEKWRTPEYQDLVPEQAKRVALSAASGLSVFAGRILDVNGPVAERTTEPMLATIVLGDDTPCMLRLPHAHTAFVFVHAGSVRIADETVAAGTLAVLGPGDRVQLTAERERSLLLFAAARPIGEPIARGGPFVMNTEAEIRQAYADYRSGTLAL